MEKLLLLVLFILTNNLYIQAQEFEWVADFNTFIDSQDKNIITDNLGNVYQVGDFYNTVDFDPGIGVYNLTSNNGFDTYILKLDKNGKFLWAKSFNDVDIRVNSFAIDSYNNIYFTGFFTNKICDFDLGPGVYNMRSEHGDDMFILKLDENGEFVWAKSLGGLKLDLGESIETDSDNNIYISGIYGGKVDFDMGVDSFYINSNASNGNYDIFILKLNQNGDFIWAKSIGDGLEEKSIYTIVADSNKSVCITGRFTGNIDFDPGAGVFSLTTNPGEFDVYILKLDKDGNFLWVKTIPELEKYQRVSMVFDSNHNLFLTNYFKGTVDFDLGPNIFILTSKGLSDIFLLKLDKDGEFVWAKRYGGTGNSGAASIDIDDSNNIYITGYFSQDMNFDTGTTPFKLNSNGKGDILILKLNNNGEFIWAENIGGLKRDFGIDITLDLMNNIFVTGKFCDTIYSDTVDFDPGPDTFNLISNIQKPDAFILKLSQCPTTFDTMHINTCDSYTWIDGNTYTSSTDTAEYILPNAEGCDSIVSLELTINHRDSTMYQYTECNSIIWKGDTLTSSGVYTYDTLTMQGCDSTVILDLTIHNTSSSTLEKTTCDSYLWNGQSYTNSGKYTFDTLNIYGCDSTATLNLTIHKSDTTEVQKSQCESYIWHDSTYTLSGIYRFDTVNIYGCDSIVSLDLTILDKIEKLDTIDICQGDTVEIFDQQVWEERLLTETFTSQKGCDSIQNIQVVVTPLPQGTITESICEGDSVFVINRWYSAEGDYQIQKQNTTGCDSIYDIIIEQRPIFSTYDTIDICQGDTIEVFGFIISEEKDIEQSYVGSNDCDSTVYMHIGVLSLSSSQSQITICPGDSILIADEWINTSGTYQETLTGANGCDSISNIQLTVLSIPAKPTVEIDCDIPQIIASIDAPYPWHIQWDTGDTTGTTIYTSGNIATLILTTNTGCELQYTVDLPHLPDISRVHFPDDTIVDQDAVMFYDLGLSEEEWSVEWTPSGYVDCDTCMQVQLNATEDIALSIQLTHISGCSYDHTFTIGIKEKELIIPNIFTPDGDGINDKWHLQLPKGFKILSCSIYDRWGEKIYSTKGAINWDGSYKGSSVLSGVYVYIIEYEDGEGEKQVVVGDVTVVR